MHSLPPPLENKTDATPERPCGLGTNYAISSFHTAPSQPPLLSWMSAGNWHPRWRTVFLNLLVRQLISLYRESVSWLLHKIPSVSLIQPGGCAQRIPRPQPGYPLALGTGGIALKPHKLAEVRIQTCPKQLCTSLLKFLWNLEHWLPLDIKWGPFFGTSNTVICYLPGKM